MKRKSALLFTLSTLTLFTTGLTSCNDTSSSNDSIPVAVEPDSYDMDGGLASIGSKLLDFALSAVSSGIESGVSSVVSPIVSSVIGNILDKIGFSYVSEEQFMQNVLDSLSNINAELEDINKKLDRLSSSFENENYRNIYTNFYSTYTELADFIDGLRKRLFPNFSFLDAPYNLKYYKKGDYNSEVAYMGCRTRVMANVYDPTNEVTCGRGNLSFTSVNLPRLGIDSHGDLDLFFKKLNDISDLIIKQLLDRLEIQRHRHVKNMPFLMGQGIWLGSDKLSWDDEIDSVIRHGSLTMGFIGLAECLVALIGKHHGESEAAQDLGLKIVKTMRDKMDEACEKYKLNFALIATPAEGLSGRFINIDNQDMVYKGENIKRSEIKKANYVSINVNDIFGKEYSSSLIRLK